ncbi:MAG TPA: ASCH domain-containing protein [Candidatus Limnocylindrales bacterium]|nr:ASCH domain-containing protein [Candidatus Limnocylindrales bacterium]
MSERGEPIDMAEAAEAADIPAFWAAYVAAAGVDGPYTAWGFADGAKPELMTALGLLVRDGPKRATTSRADDYGPDEPMPEVGDHSVILDGDGRPICIIRTTSIEIRPFGDVEEAFAWEEGEGDRTMAWWRGAHIRFFASVRTPIDDATPVVL